MAEPGRFDIVLIGAGLAASASAVTLARKGMSVGVVVGAARPRSIEAAGGLVDPRLLESAFGNVEAPLGPEVRWRQSIAGRFGDARIGPREAMPVRRAYRRDELEAWALRQATASGALVLEDFAEGLVVPDEDGDLRLTSEDDRRSVAARIIALCEGADPRIAMRAGLRPDYPPEEQVHLATTRIVHGNDADELVYLQGWWRTSWGMPVHVAVVPQGGGSVVTVAARIENVMRCNRSTKEALDELLAAPALASVMPRGERVASGVELVALRGDHRRVRLAAETLLIGADAAGVLDPRDVDRANRALRAGIALASVVSREGVGGSLPDAWQEAGTRLLRELAPEPAVYRESRETGFVEETGDGPGLPAAVDRLRRGVLARLRGG